MRGIDDREGELKMAELKAGDPAPDFELLDQKSQKITLRSFQGKKLLLYFYPKADTSG